MREMASVCKDGNGFIWASSKTGILRITESDYRIYQLPYKTANIINVKLAYNNSFLILNFPTESEIISLSLTHNNLNIFFKHKMSKQIVFEDEKKIINIINDSTGIEKSKLSSLIQNFFSKLKINKMTKD